MKTMRTTLAGFAAALLLTASIGCEKSTVEGPAGMRLTIVKPMDQSLKRGETNEVTVMIARENFSGDVKVTFENLPRGVTVIEDKPIAADKSRGTWTLHASNEADLVANQAVRVTVIGPNAMAATEVFMLTVKDKEGSAEPPKSDRP